MLTGYVDCIGGRTTVCMLLAYTTTLRCFSGDKQENSWVGEQERNSEIILGSEVLCDIQVLAGFVGVDSGNRCSLETWISEGSGRDLRWSLHSCISS